MEEKISLVNVSEGASLTLHGLALIVKKQPQRLCVKILAEELYVPRVHLAKIFQKLSKQTSEDE